MKIFLTLLLTLALLLPVTPAMAQQMVSALEQSPETVGELVVPPKHSSETVAELEKLIEAMYADIENLRQRTSPGMQEVLAVGAGAGLGFLASGWLMTGVISPLVHSYAAGVGLSELTASLLTASATTVGIVSGTYAGGMYARNLVTD